GQGQVFTNRTFSGARRLLITGGSAGIYESSNEGEVISLVKTRSTSLGTVLSAVYGGRFARPHQPPVAYIEYQNGILLRTAAGGAFNSISTYPNFGSLGGRAITVDPQDWHNVYAVESGYRSTSPLHVWWSNNAGAAGSWVEITGNLNSY